eukprot:2756411-Rhodomonas_salina.2
MRRRYLFLDDSPPCVMIARYHNIAPHGAPERLKHHDLVLVAAYYVSTGQRIAHYASTRQRIARV